MKRVLAIIGVILILALYVLTFIFSIIDDPKTMSFFRASVAMTILIPVMIYGYQLVYRVLKGNDTKGEEK
ncbi:MAG: hypothetical protein Q4E51_05970 [Lachnospiraceae bacterium]|nr:hypothetical protein [Lachnospiraceae bacterium]